MQIGYIGLGKMGKNMALRLIEKGHDVIAWNRSPDPRKEVAAAGAVTAETVEELVSKLQGPKIVWVMLPAGQPTIDMITKLSVLLTAGDIIIDGANSFYKNTLKCAELLTDKGIKFIDAGVSGGPTGARNGACVMIGGDEPSFKSLEPLFADISNAGAYCFFRGHGAGHFAKMVHNGIEYGMMQAIGEGFEVLKKSSYDYDLQQVAELYQAQSVIESRLVGWLVSGYQKHGNDLEGISGSVAHSGEGQWTIETAKEYGIPTPVISASLNFRVSSTDHPSYTGQVVSTLRNEFGGHDVKKK